MNIYAIIILTTLLVDFILGIISDLLNLKALNPQLPEEFAGHYDAEKYEKSQRYTRVNTRFGFVTGTFDIAVTLVFWFAAGFQYLDGIVRGWDLHAIWTGLSYIGILVLLKMAISRKREFLADANGALLTRYPPGLASALKKLSEDKEPLEAANKATAHMYIVNPLKDIKGRVNKLFSTHPPIEKRIAALEKM